MIEDLKKGISNEDREYLRLKLSAGLNFQNEEIKELIEFSKKYDVNIIKAILINRIPNAIIYFTKIEKENLIINLISEISENIYSAEWYDKIEVELWNWTKENFSIPENLKHRVAEDDLKDLKNISTRLNLWARWENGKNPQAIDLREWKKMNN